ncbi:peptidoglycan-binding protein [Streptomyces sp. JJ36]|uniref:peptidoglycan-binding domain-containing protein n=1 Tax=Streptomyces sp. JJ36 TaxID=2736645 RepID=UPI001F433C85|nr:peptidoglycan-binding domain-containing protein [Streptomyces sp. JJ36]MCF6525089.1 peptidoglycan-binding protein [Streptomyces sp. JJ36]
MSTTERRQQPCDHTKSRPTLRRGSEGPPVRQAQCYLNYATTGDDLVQDGVFGPVTEAAARRFQRCAGITVDGVIGAQTWSFLTYWANSAEYVC